MMTITINQDYQQRYTLLRKQMKILQLKSTIIEMKTSIRWLKTDFEWQKKASVNLKINRN